MCPLQIHLWKSKCSVPPNVALFGEKVFLKVIQHDWWVSPYEEGIWTETRRKTMRKIQGEKPGERLGQVLPHSPPKDRSCPHLGLNFQPPELRDSKFLSLKPLRLRYCVVVAPGTMWGGSL